MPGDIGVIGFSNEFFTAVTVPALSTIDQCCEQLGQAALQLLLEVYQADAAQLARHVVLRPQLLARASSTRPTPPWPGSSQFRRAGPKAA